MRVVKSQKGEPVGMPWRFCAFGRHVACVTRFHDACALHGWRWRRWDGRYGFNESRPRDFGERSWGVGSCLAQVSACLCL